MKPAKRQVQKLLLNLKARHRGGNMKKKIVVCLLLIFVLFPECVFSDYLKVTRSATLKSNPVSGSTILLRPAIGSTLELLDENQTNGYYYARDLVSDQEGYIYRTLVRRFPGEIASENILEGREYLTHDLTPSFFTANDPTMWIHFLDVGQADAAVVEFPCGVVLIDAGYRGSSNKTKIVDYLKDFFDSRSNLSHDTIDAVIITHNHSDHTSGLKSLFRNFTILNFIDNGQDHKGQQKWVRDSIRIGNLDTDILGLSDDDIPSTGLVDNLSFFENCPETYSQITFLTGSIDTNSEWWSPAFENQNNHSLTVRVDFGESSALFTGDLQDRGIEKLLYYFGESDLLDVDIYQVGHHGSHNATTIELVKSMSPELAVISMSDPNYKGSSKSAWGYGHPRKDIVEMIQNNILDLRAPSVRKKVAKKSKNFKNMLITKRIYATGWDGDIIVNANSNGLIEVGVSD